MNPKYIKALLKNWSILEIDSILNFIMLKKRKQKTHNVCYGFSYAESKGFNFPKLKIFKTLINSNISFGYN